MHAVSSNHSLPALPYPALACLALPYLLDKDAANAYVNIKHNLPEATEAQWGRGA